MNNLDKAKEYALSQRESGKSASQILHEAIILHPIKNTSRGTLLTYIYHHVMIPQCDATMCGRYGLLGLRLPLNRIAEVFHEG